jgi:flagellar P-ring protein precursor FlgI
MNAIKGNIAIFVKALRQINYVIRALVNYYCMQGFRILYSLLIIVLLSPHTCTAARLKDVVNFEGIRHNKLVGHGIVVGLNASGDNLKNSKFTREGMLDMLYNLGVNVRGGTELKTKNVAAVMVTAELPPFARSGNQIAVKVFTIGDAKSLKGGTLIATQLLGADGEVYAVAQGEISIGDPSSPSNPKLQPIPTAGFITNGATVEREVDFELNNLDEMKIALKNPDISTARSIATAINSSLQGDNARATDPGTVVLKVPEKFEDNVLGLLADIENLSVQPDQNAKIVVDASSGTVVINKNVRISPVAIAHGNITLKVSDEEQLAYSLGITKEKPQESEPGEKIAIMKEQANLNDLVEGLNALGVIPQDLVAILTAIKSAGALQAEIEMR